MAEDNKGTGDNKSAEQTPAEEKASKSGWRPREDWKGEADEWVNAAEFNYRGQLMGRISEQSSILNNFKNQIAERDTAIKDMAQHHKNVAEIEYKKALKMLQDAKVEAIDEGDGESVVRLDDEIDDLKAQARKRTPKVNPKIKDTTPPEVIDWLQKPHNKWYVNDPFLKSVADGIAKGIIQANPQTSATRLLEQMDEKIRQELPHRFDGNPSVNQSDADDVANSSNRTKGKGRKLGMRDLDEEQQEVAKRFIKTKVMTLTEYIDDLKAIGAI